MANLPNRPKGRSIRNLRMVWGFALNYPGHIAVAALALLVAAAATSGVPYAFKLIIDKGFAAGAGSTRDIGRWFQYLLLLVGVMATATAVRGLKAPDAVAEILPLLKNPTPNVIRDACRTLSVLGSTSDVYQTTLPSFFAASRYLFGDWALPPATRPARSATATARARPVDLLIIDGSPG